MDDKTEVVSDEEPTTDNFDTSFNAGIKAGREEAWSEAIMILKSAAATAYISGGDTREAQQLRQICLQMLEAAHPITAGRGRAG